MARSFIDEIRYYELAKQLRKIKSSGELVTELDFLEQKETLLAYQILYVNLMETIEHLNENCPETIKELYLNKIKK